MEVRRRTEVDPAAMVTPEDAESQEEPLKYSREEPESVPTDAVPLESVGVKLIAEEEALERET